MMRPALFAKIGPASLSAAVMSVILLGCGSGDDLGKRYAVYGSVTYNGKPLEKGNILFYPATPDPKGINNGANGVIVNGEYTLSSRGEDDGAFPGDYLVSITSREADLTKAEANVKAGVLRQDDVAKANAKAKSLIPTKYANLDSSGLKAKVEAKSNKFDFALTD